MRFIKELFIVCAFGVVVLCVMSCMSSDVEIYDYTSTIVTAQKASDGTIYFVADDDSTTYLPEPRLMDSDSLVGHRCYVEYAHLTPAENYTYTMHLSGLQLVREQKLLEISSAEDMEKFGDGGEMLSLAWASGHYVNMVVDYYGTQGVEHEFSLVRNVNAVNPNDSVIVLELRHDTKYDDDSQVVWFKVLSYDISALLAEYSEDFYLQIHYRRLDKTFDDVIVKVDVANVATNEPIKSKRIGRLH